MAAVKIQYTEIPKGKRILVTSDIHGHIAHLENVLTTANFSDDDILVIVGDMIEKGPESLNTLRYIMKLCENGNVFPLPGNVDIMRCDLIRELCAENVQGFYDYIISLREWISTSFFDELTLELGHICLSPEEMLEIKDEVLVHFCSEFEFFYGLPTILETQNYIFVHGGLRDKELRDNEKRNIFDLLKYDGFMTTTKHCFDKYVIAGHWPVLLYGKQVPSCAPIKDREKKIISIDGGCGVKSEGQLNLLIIPEIDCSIDDIHHISCSGMPKIRALSRQKESEDIFYTHWPDNEIELLEKREECSYVLHIATGRRLWMPNRFVSGSTRCKDFTDYALPVEQGDVMSLIAKTERGYYAKKNDVIGWYYGEAEEIAK